MPYLTRLSTLSTSPGNPWEFQPLLPIPDNVRGKSNKKERDRWINDPGTDHNVYSLVVGVNPGQRVSAPSKLSEGNPPRELLGFCADYDAPVSEEALKEGLANLGRHQPNYFERTLSGNARLLWLFDKPVSVPGYQFTKEFFVFVQGKIRFDLVAPCLDKGAFEAPERYYTNACDWFVVQPTPMPSALVVGWLQEFSTKFKWAGAEFNEVGIPLPDIAAELAQKFPRFSEWTGPFEEGAQGPTFWVDGSTSPKSAIVRATGMQTFADHAGKPFFHWVDLLGTQFLDRTKAVNLGAAVDNIFFDGRSYFRQLPSGVYRPFDRSDLSQHLKVTRKLSPKPDKAGTSQIDSALQFIQDHGNVVGAAPFAFRPHGRFFLNGEPVLNTHSRRVLTPAEKATKWGDEGEFPWLSKFLTGFFDPTEQLEFFLAWLARFYATSHALDPRSGHNIFIAGDQNTGKTLLSRRIIGGLMNGSVEATDFLMGADKFGSELFDSAVWTIDDGTAAADRSGHKRFSDAVKRMAANPTHRYHAKFRVPLMVQWQGRVIVTCNRDEESIQMLPDLSLTLLDKIMLFRAADKAAVRFPEQAEMDRILERELPWFARFLLDYVTPEHLVSPDTRFGVRCHHDESLVIVANQSSRSAVLTEVLMDWKDDYFEGNKGCHKWEGTAYQLHKAILMNPASAQATKSMTSESLARGLVTLKTKGDKTIECRQDGPVRVFTIHRENSEQPKETPEPAVKSDSRFSKP